MGDIGRITEIEPEDGLGWIELGNGDRVRFGGTACKGFVPAIGMAVEVLGTKPGFRGVLKATEVRKAAEASAAPSEVAGGPAAAPAPRTSLHTLQSSGVRADDLILTLLGRADVDHTLHADLEALMFQVQPMPSAEIDCLNPWLYVVAMNGGGDAYGLYTHPLLPEGGVLPWVVWNHEDDMLRCLASDTSTFLRGMLASAAQAGVDPAIVARTQQMLVKMGMAEGPTEPFGDGATAPWLPPEDDVLRPLAEYLAETDGAEMERGLLAYAWRRQDAQATEALRSLYETWEWTPPA